MTIGPRFHIIQKDITQTFEEFSERARHQSDPWRCLHASLPQDMVIEIAQRQIVETFLKEALDEVDKAEIFWMTSGELFVFFQGPVRQIIKNFELFLEKVQGDNQHQKADYKFFWELVHFWGYYDEVLSNALHVNTIVSNRSTRKKPLLLIVEDDRPTRHMMQAIMEQSCDILVAWNAQQAEELYKHAMPNMAFLDIQIPYGDGEDLVKTLCAYDPDSFIVMVSGVLNPGRSQRCLDAGAKACVPKPARQEDLLPFVEQYCRGSIVRAS